ncbi:MAG: hypothetical protein KDC48_11310 [Planctomycetes bacterium]|nr:hypothetical protein [Planctomycetota bacterium]
MAAGWFTVIGGVPAPGIARWNGANWSALGGGPGWEVRALATLANGDLAVGGGDFFTGNVASWDGTTWTQLGVMGGGMFTPGATVNALAVLPSGDLVAGGTFQTVSGVNANHIARWDGAAWHPLGSGFTPVLGANNWVAVNALVVQSNGNLVAAGSFSDAGGAAAPNGIATWDGTSWSAPLPQILAVPVSASAVAVLPNGGIVVSWFYVPNVPWPAGAVSGVELWDGAGWQSLSGEGASSFLTLPDGDVVACGSFQSIGGVPAAGLARWNGATWSAFGPVAGGSVLALAETPAGTVIVGGDFMPVGASAPTYVAGLTSGCPASVVATGSGCIGNVGSNVLTATSLPWLGATFSSVATGLPANAFALEVFGFAAASVPLSAIHPQGRFGCNLLTTAELVHIHATGAGSITTAIAIPDLAALVGLVVHQQVVPIEFDAQGHIAGLTSTNRLRVTIGAW